MNPIDWLRALERVESILLIANDEEAKRVIVAWASYRPEFEIRDIPEAKLESLSIKTILKHAWDDVGEIEFDRLCMISGLSWRRTKDIFERLKESLLIYPDGTISKNVTAMLSAEAASRLRPLMGNKK